MVDAAAIEARLRAEYEEIAVLCTLSGHPELVAEMIASKKTVAAEAGTSGGFTSAGTGGAAGASAVFFSTC